MNLNKLFKIIVVGLFATNTWAQYQLRGTFTDSLPQVENIALYKITTQNHQYLKYFKTTGKQFSFSLDSLETGFYRLKYKNKPSAFVDFVYNQENIHLSLNSEIGMGSVKFLESFENDHYQKYLNTIKKLQTNVEKAQLAVLDNKPKAKENYTKALQLLQFNQKQYESLAKDKYVYDFVVAGTRYYPLEPYKTIEEFYENSRKHFFDYIDFNNIKLRNSNLIKDKVLGFVFDFNQINNKLIMDAMFKESMQQLTTKITDKAYLETFYEMIASQLVFRENKEGIDILLSFYKALPKENNNELFLKQLTTNIKTLLGATAPDIQIYHDLKMSQLSSEYTLLLFWSTACAHCAIEIPAIHKMLQNQSKIAVVAVGLESKEDLKKWETKARELTGWRHVCAPGAWEHPVADLYNLYATPTYFILDKNKTIVAKPRNDRAIEEWLKTIQKP